MIEPIDPFAHLAHESFADAFALPRLDHQSLVHTRGRTAIPLVEGWRFSLDPFEEGLRQRWFADPPSPPEAWSRPRDYEPDGGALVAVPSVWNCLRPEWRYYEGSAWYARDFTWAPGPGAERLILRIGAAAGQARVFLNGHFLGRHRGGSSPFCVELTGALDADRNRLLIQADNTRRADTVPMHHFDWFNYGGLFREVTLLPLPATFIAEFAIFLVPGSDFRRLSVRVVLSDPAEGTARIAIPALDLSFPVPIVGGRGEVEIEARPRLWSPRNPTLYDVALRFGEDCVRDSVGFREIRVAGHDILLNGRSIRLSGIAVHEDDRVLGRVTDEADIRRRFADAKALGCNFLRLAHYPHHERVAEIADALGFLLWEEIPVYWAIDFANPATYADAENQLLELIRRDANRASVIVWGIGNENADSNARFSFLSRLAAVARRADPTRLVAAACLIDRVRFAIADRLAAELDLIGINEYFGWYEPDLSHLARLLTNSAPDRPVVITEMGADAYPGLHGPEDRLFTEECQARIYREQLRLLATAPYVRGLCPWLLYDFRSERRQTRYQQGISRKGLIADDKITRKAAFAVLARHYAAMAGKEDEPD